MISANVPEVVVAEWTAFPSWIRYGLSTVNAALQVLRMVQHVRGDAARPRPGSRSPWRTADEREDCYG